MEIADTGSVATRPTTVRVDDDVTSRFATCCRALGLTIYERTRPADLAAARSGFTGLVRIAHDQADAWVGLAAAGDLSLPVLEAISHNVATAGVLQRQVELAPGALGFQYDTGLYLKFRANEPDDFHLAYAAALAGDGRFAAAHQLVSEVGRRRPSSREARWVSATIQYRAERWSDVVKLLSPIVNDPGLDEHFAHAVKVALGVSLARLGMFAAALSYLQEPDGPVAVAAVDGALARALSLRADGDEDTAREVLQDLYAANPENAQVEEALTDSSFGIVPTTADRIAARIDPWNPATEPKPGDFVDPGAQERKAMLLSEAERELDEFIGLERVKDQVARLKSAVAMELVRKERGLEVAQRTHHLVFTGPPGTGKTTIARVVAKIYCGLGLLKKENIKEVHRLGRRSQRERTSSWKRCAGWPRAGRSVASWDAMRSSVRGLRPSSCSPASWRSSARPADQEEALAWGASRSAVLVAVLAGCGGAHGEVAPQRVPGPLVAATVPTAGGPAAPKESAQAIKADQAIG